MGVKCLPGRHVYVLTRQQHLSLFGGESSAFWDVYGDATMDTHVTYINDVRHFPPDGFLGGGASLYKQYLFGCSELILTVLDYEVKGDSYFPADYARLFPNYELIEEGKDYQIWRYFR